MKIGVSIKKYDFDSRYLIIGPMKVTCTTENADLLIYTVSAYGPAGGRKTAYICDSNGNSNSSLLEGAGTKTFYIKVPISQVDEAQGFDGIARIELTATVKGIQEKSNKKSGYLEYYYDNSSQTIRTIDRHDVYRYDEEIETHVEDQVTWTDFNVWLDITKVDNNDEEKTLSGVQFCIQRGSKKYLKVEASKQYTDVPKGYDDKNEWVDNINDATVFSTDQDGKCEIKNLRGGIFYTIVEKKNPNYGYEDNSVNNESDVLNKFDITSDGENRYGKIYRVKLENTKQTGNLIIEKRDAEQQNNKLKGVTFKIRVGEKTLDGKTNPNKGKYVKITAAIGGGVNISKNTCTGYVHVQDMAFVNDVEDATRFITNENGLIVIYNILKGYYEVEENDVGNLNKDLYDVDEKHVSWQFESMNQDWTELNKPGNEKDKADAKKSASQSKVAYIRVFRRNSTNTSDNKIINMNSQDKPYDYLVFNNKRKYIKLSGRVWEDIQSGKIDKRNDLYKQSIHPDFPEYLDENNTSLGYEDDKDITIGNITVRLKDKTTGEVIQETQTGANTGSYQFKDVLIEKLKDYYIEFEYDGLTYTNVASYKEIISKYSTSQEETTQREYLNKINQNRTSKAVENSNVRQEFNDRFAEVKGMSSDTGVTIGKDGKEKYKVNYEIGNHEATLKSIEALDPEIKTTVIANTLDAEYSLDQYEPGLTEINNINLGLYRRDMPDIALINDISNVKLTINGKAHVYEYAQRYLNADEYGGEGFNIGVKFGEKYGSMSYSRPIYKADYEYETSNKSNELEVYITYDIRVRNQSNLKINVNSIVDYYDSRYELVKIGTGLTDGNITGNEIGRTDLEQYGNYKKTIINSNLEIDSGKDKDVYVQFRLDRNAVLNILNSKENLNNVAEINSYTSYIDNMLYAGIDSDSNPGNTIPDDNQTYEDDTDKAPGLLLETVLKERQLSGKVFLDSSVLTETGERMGNGKYEDGETGIPEVKVTLKENSGSGKEYTVNSTDSNGDFVISGFIPGEYKVVYTWGDDTYKVQDYKGTIWTDENISEKSEDPTDMWYKNQTIDNKTNKPIRFSDAKDNYETRILIDKETKDTESNQYTINKMDSITNNMNIGIEITDTKTTSYDDKFIPKGYNIENIDFGIVERPRQSLQIEKRVENLKIVSAMGQTMIDAHVIYDENQKQYKLENEVKYVTYMPPSNNILQGNGIIKAEIDDELIQYSRAFIKYKITVKNTSEKDYNSENYYLYGKLSEDEDEPPDKYIIALKPIGVYDLYENMVFKSSENNNKWIFKEESQYNNEQSADSLIEKAFNEWNNKNIGDSTVEESGFEYYRKEYYQIINSWNETHIRESKLNNKTILFNTGELEQELKPQQEVSQELQLEKELGISDEIDLNNDCEISKIEKTTDGGRRITPAYSIIYDRGESVRITTPTGENHNYLEMILIAISGLITIGTGIVFIKKKILRN